MGVLLGPAVKDHEGHWHHRDFPWPEVDAQTGFTYTNWRNLLHGLCLHEAHYQVGHIPTAMLAIHLDRFGFNISQGYEQSLRAIIKWCEDHGIAHIGWA